MSRLNAGLYSSDDQTWWSPPDFVAAVLGFEERERFDLDAATTAFNIPARFHYTKGGLYKMGRAGARRVKTICGYKGDWQVPSADLMQAGPLVWVNPEYGEDEHPCKAKCKKKICVKRGHHLSEFRPGLPGWTRKIYAEAQKGARIWALLPCRTETSYQHQFGLSQADFVVVIKSRLHFLRDGKPHIIVNSKTGKESKGSAPMPTMLLYYGADWEGKMRRWMANPPIPGTLLVRPEKLMEKRS